MKPPAGQSANRRSPLHAPTLHVLAYAVKMPNPVHETGWGLSLFQDESSPSLG